MSSTAPKAGVESVDAVSELIIVENANIGGTPALQPPFLSTTRSEAVRRFSALPAGLPLPSPPPQPCPAPAPAARRFSKGVSVKPPMTAMCRQDITMRRSPINTPVSPVGLVNLRMFHALWTFNGTNQQLCISLGRNSARSIVAWDHCRSPLAKLRALYLT